MKFNSLRSALALCCAALVLSPVPGFPQAPTSPAPRRFRPAAKVTSSSSFGCGSLSVTLGSTVPGDALIGNQTDADCFAWAQFVALNWPTVTSSFGAPGDLTPVQWQTYMQQESLYPPNGQAPPVWGAQSQAPTGCATDGNLRSHRGMRVLSTKGKFGSTPKGIGAFLPPEIQEAAPATGPAWLGAQNGTNVWFEVVLNKDIYNFVTDPSHQFYNATKQQSWVNNGQGQPIVFPKGTLSGSPVGAVELKAAWMEVPGYNPAQPGKWAKYKLSPAVVVGPSNSQCRVTTVALVGLHIIHKTGSQPTWVWSTFEHVDNVPGPNQTAECCNFNSSTCKPQQVTVSQASCLGPNQTSPVTVSCTPNTPPPFNIGPGCPSPVPIQVTRTTALDSTSLKVNKTAWAGITAAYPKSVFQYYQLVDVLWSTNPTQDPTTPQKVPLNPAHLTSGNPGNVFNTTMETYFQSSQCTDCHKSAAIAPFTSNLPWDTDFSFAIGGASPATSTVPSKSSKKAKTVAAK